MRKFTLLFATLLSLLGVTQVKADEITVYDGTGTSNYLPLYGYYADTKGVISEFIIPSSQLTALSGETIEQLVFYLSSPAESSFGSASFNVYLEEVVGSNYDDSSASQLTDSKTLVYTGALDATGTTMDIPFTNNFTYNGGNLLIAIEVGTGGSYKAATFYGTTTSNNTGRYKYGSSSGRVKFIPKTTFITPTVGAALTVKDGSQKLTSPYAYNFGLATAGTSKTFTLANPGTKDLAISVSKTGDFNATLSATTITAGGEVTLTVTMPETTGSSAVTITPDATSGIDPFVINVSGTIRDANKVYLDFADGQMPEGWTSVGIGSYTSDTYAWKANTGYVSTSASSSYYCQAFTSPKLTFAKDELIAFESAKYGSSSYYTPSITVEYSLDGNTWTAIGSAFTDDVYDTWTSRSVTIPVEGVKYIRFNGWYINLRNIYGGEIPNEPNMKVTQPTSLDFGAITETTTKTFTIANTGRATLEGINVTSSNAAFTITGAPTSLEAGASQEVTITMSTANTGALSSDITVSATGMENVTFTVTGVVLPEGMFVVDFNDNALPEGWTNASWTFANGEATGKSYSAYLTTPKLVFSEGDILVIKAKRSDSDASDYITVQGSSDNGSTWTAYNKKISGSDGLAYPDYGTIVLSDIPTTVNKLRFVGYYVIVDEIAGLTYAPVLNVTTGDPATAVSSPASYDFGECAIDAYVTYNFTNAGAGTININNVTITGEGAAAYSTNWTESTAAPFELKITRTYDATRTEAQAAVITVTTSEGDFVINVTGTDKAANAPELAVDVTSLDFGKLTADDTKTVTVTNNGTGQLTVNIASDSEDFVVSAATLENIAAGESKTFDVTFKFSTNYGAKSGNITVTPTYDAEAVQTIAVTAKALDPDMWTEYFEGNALPTGWEAGSNWSFADGVAKAAWAYGSTKYYLTTPKLEVSATTDELAFDYKANANYVSVKIEMSKDGSAWTTCNTTPAMSTINNGDAGTATITGLEPGIYQFRFANDDYQLDNFEGFKLKAAAAHEAEVADGGLTIPVTGNQYVEYTASVKVKVTGTNDEELTVKFFIGDTQYGEAVTKEVASNATETFEVTFTPDAAVNGNAYFTIESTDITAFQSNTVAVTIAAATVLDETVAPELTEGIVPSLLLKYTRYNGWNTICVPFELTSGILNTIFGNGWKAYEFKGYSDGTLNFETATTFVAGYPYIIYVENAQTNTDDIVLLNVNISKLTAQYDSNNDAYFRGSYAPIADMNGLWGITGEGRIAKGTADASIDGFRAYFELPSTTTGAPLLSIDGGPATRIHSIDNGQLTIDNAYDLSGRRVAQPSKGLYIINGKKVILK